MKYLESIDNIKKNIDRIVGEMINIERNTTYFIEGKLVDNPKNGHNKYMIGSVMHEIYPIAGCVHILSDKVTRYGSSITTTHLQFIQDIKNKFGSIKPVAGAHKNTTQYVLVRKTPNPSYTDKVDININGKVQELKLYTNNRYGHPYHKKVDFTWYIYTNIKNLSESAFYIPNVINTKISMHKQLLSLSSIIFDDMDLLNWVNGHVSPDMPLITDYDTKVQNNTIIKHINFGTKYGITIELAKHFIDVRKYCSEGGLHFKFSGTTCYSRRFNSLFQSSYSNKISTYYSVIFWLHWNNVNPYRIKTSNRSIQSIVKNFVNGNIERIVEDYDVNQVNVGESPTLRNIANKTDYRCCISGMPIYEDCYVFSVRYKSICIEVPKSKAAAELKKPNSEIKNYFNVTKPASEIKNYDPSDIKISIASTPAKKGKKKTTKKKITKKKTTKKKTTKKKTTISTASNEEKKITSTEEKKITTNTEEPTTITVKMVRIYRMIELKEPIRLLVSPLVVHFGYGTIKYLTLSEFENKFHCKAVMYRSFCPRLAVDLIKLIPNVSNTYREFLEAFYYKPWVFLDSNRRLNYTAQHPITKRTFHIKYKLKMHEFINSNTNEIYTQIDHSSL